MSLSSIYPPSTFDALICLDRTTGQQKWRVPISLRKKNQKPGMSCSLVLSEEALYFAPKSSLTAYRLSDGAEMWKGNVIPNHYKAPDVFLTGGFVGLLPWPRSENRPGHPSSTHGRALRRRYRSLPYSKTVWHKRWLRRHICLRIGRSVFIGKPSR